MKKIIAMTCISSMLVSCMHFVHFTEARGKLGLTTSTFDPLGNWSKSMSPVDGSQILVYLGLVPAVPIAAATFVVSAATIPIQYPFALIATTPLPSLSSSKSMQSDKKRDWKLYPEEVEAYEFIIMHLDSVIAKKKANQQDYSLEQKEVDRLKERMKMFKENLPEEELRKEELRKEELRKEELRKEELRKEKFPEEELRKEEFKSRLKIRFD